MRASMCFFWLLIFIPQVACGEANTCDRAAKVAASEVGVPLGVLLSLTRTETGRLSDGQLQPWPWTVNMEGQGYWFADETTARGFVFRHFKMGARNFDVGCFQLNYKWHGDAFRSIEAMFDPRENALYAARFLLSHKSPNGSWAEAAGAYHSKTPKYAKAYESRFAEIHSTMQTYQKTPHLLGTERSSPLLPSTNEQGFLGSLVSLSENVAKPLLSNGERG